MNTPADIAMWNNGAANPMMKSLGPLANMFKLPSFTGNKRSTIINFETGKIVMKFCNYLADPISETYKKYPAIPRIRN